MERGVSSGVDRLGVCPTDEESLQKLLLCGALDIFWLLL